MINITIMIIIVVMILLILFFLKIDHSAKRIKILIILVVILLIYLSATNFFTSDKAKLDSPKGIATSVYDYFGWIGTALGNMWDATSSFGKTIGNVIKTTNSTSNSPKFGK